MGSRQGIHWFPGHMRAALEAIKERLRIVDLAIVIGDARAPISSINPYLEAVLEGKEKVLLLAKADLADASRFDAIKKHYQSSYKKVFFVDLKASREVNFIKKQLLQIETPKSEKYQRLGLAHPPLRALVVGIPNVGKSTFINAVAQKHKAGVANTPGFTRSQQLVKVSDTFELYDTPGVLSPNYDDRSVAMRLAWLGSLKLDILPRHELVAALAEFLLREYRDNLYNRYQIVSDPYSVYEAVSAIALNRHYRQREGGLDLERAELALLKDFQSGSLGRVVVDDLERI